MSEEESIARLRHLGLNLYESRAYIALLNGKELTAKGVGQSALIPQSRTYDVLESLTRKGFALASPAAPPVYVPVPPEKVLGRYYDLEREKIKERAAKVQEEAQAKLEVIREAYLALTKDYPTAPERGQAMRDQVWVLQKRENIENTLSGYIRDAKFQVLRVTKPPEPASREPIDPFYILGVENQRFTDETLERKVEMRWLRLSREIPTFLGLQIPELPERRYLDKEDDITEKFFLVDKHSVLLNLHDPMASAYGYTALAMRSKAVSLIFLDHFEKMWRKAKPLADILPKTRRLVEEVRDRMTAADFAMNEVMIYRTLARMGAVPQDALIEEVARKKIQPQAVTASLNRLLKLGLVYRDYSLKRLMVEHPTNVKRILDKL